MVEAATLGSILLWAAIGAIGAALVVSEVWMRRLLVLGVTLAWASILILVVALVTGDFTLEYVARTTSRATPWPYRVSALWGGMEGSLLFYAAMLGAIGTYGIRRSGRIEAGVVALVTLGFLLLTALAADPFSRLDIPAVDGGGLLAILQHPAMIYHPPILYLGLTTLVVPFAITLGWVRGGGGASYSGPLDLPAWLLPTRRWLTWSWTWLTIGMVTGANWAYIELGWGGFWAWDPVENTALMPWLAVTVFFHASRVYRRDGRLHRATVLFALFPFVLSVLGVYLTRSGMTGSIHSFAEDPVVGRILLVAAILITALVAVSVGRTGRGPEWGQVGAGRDTWLATCAGLVSLALLFILIGSAYPAFLKVFWDRTVVVGPGFFVTTVLPVALAITALIGLALKTTWFTSRVEKLDIALALGLAGGTAGLAVGFALEMSLPGTVLLAMAAGAVGLLVSDLSRHRPKRMMVPAYLAHLGIAIVLLGVGGSALGDEASVSMVPGDTVTVGDRTLVLTEIIFGETDRFLFAEGVFVLDGGPVLRPQIRAYERQGVPVAEPAMWSTPMVDILVAVTLLTPDAQGFEVSVFVRPMVWWVWVGAVILSIAGVYALVSRAGDGGGRRRSATTTPPRTGTTSVETG